MTKVYRLTAYNSDGTKAYELSVANLEHLRTEFLDAISDGFVVLTETLFIKTEK